MPLTRMRRIRVPHGLIHVLLLVVVVPLTSVAACETQDGAIHTRWVTVSREGPAEPPSTATSATPNASSKASASATPTPANFLARIPAFPPAPRAEPITLPAGPQAAWLSRIPTTQPVAFITIDDGWNKLPDGLALVKAAGIPVTLFLSVNAMRDDPGYFGKLQAAGAVIEAHTMTHTNLKGQSYGFQKQEICGSADYLGGLYGRRPRLMRPPFGEKDATTLRAASDCGMKAAIFWKETVNDGLVRYQEGNSIQRGDIILMHFRPAFVEDFLAAMRAIADAGLTPALLEDYIPGAELPAPSRVATFRNSEKGDR
jgi:peptidoglycan/xylan/chitin deacetylase (PgdA/CDA1 family)